MVGKDNSSDGRQLDKRASHQLTPQSAAILNLGRIEQIAPSETSELARQVFDLVDRARRLAGRGAERAARAPLTFTGYKNALQKRDTILRALHQENRRQDEAYVTDDSPELRRFVTKIYHPERHSPDFVGYINYAGAVHETLGEAILKLVQQSPGAQFHESDLHMHACIVGASGSGKSELLKLMVHHYVKHPELGAVLVLDPHAKVAREIARWREFAADPERLVFLDAALFGDDSEIVPAINPLMAVGASDATKAAIAGQIAAAIGMLRGDDTLSGNMISVAKRCVRVLLDIPGANLSHLAELLKAEKGHPLIQFALGSDDADHRAWFEGNGGFFGDTYKTAKAALLKRVHDAIFSPLLRHVLTAPRPFDLQAAIEARKVICIDCASVGPDDKEMFGRLIMAQVAALGQRRISSKSLPQTPLRVFVDEATLLMSPSVFVILQELRKVGISLIMGQQDLGDGLERDLVRSMRTNTKVKMFGRSDSMRDVFKMMSWDGDIPRLRDGQFVAAWGSNEKVIIDTYGSPHLADDRNAMGEADWERVLQVQVKNYYRPIRKMAKSSMVTAVTPPPPDEYEYPA